MNITDPIFNDENAAREHLEAVRWPRGPICPHCGNCDPERIRKLEGKSTRPGVHKCNECRKPFSVTVGTVFERSKIPLHKWVLATHLLTSSKKGMSAHQLHRMLGVTYKTAWFMAHRIREAMRPTDAEPFGNDGGPVEADETFIGRKKGAKVRVGYEHKYKVMALVDRHTGRARSMVVDKLNTATVGEIVRINVRREAQLVTDEARHYILVGREFKGGHSVAHHGKDE